jgi:hypothetical protein
VRLDRREHGVLHLRQRRRFRDLDGERSDAVRFVRGDDLRGGEAPRAVGDRAHAEPERIRAVGALEPPILDERVLLVAANEANVGVRGAALLRGIEGTLREIALDREAGDGQALIL